MFTSKEALRMLSSGLKTIFMNTFNAYTPVYKTLATEVMSTKSSEDYGRLGHTPQMQEWLDERKAKGLSEYWFSLKNKDYEATIAVDRNVLDDDQYGQVKIRVQQMATSAAQWYDRFLATLIESNPLCYDGQNFFDTDHSESWTSQANIFTSKALTTANAEIVLTAMNSFKNDAGMINGTRATHIVVWNDLEYTAKKIFDPATVGVTTDPADAVLKWAVKIIVLPYLTTTGTYYYVDLNQGVSPFIFQNRKPITFVALDNPDDIDVFMRKTLYYGVDARFAFGVGDWKTAVKCSA